MTQPTMRFKFHEPTIDTNAPITEGRVKVEGFDLQYVDFESDDEADAWDAGFGARVREVAEGRPLISIPAFPNRKFRLSYIYVNNSARIESPKDLEGKRVGIMGWSNTAGVWARGALQNTYGVDLTRIIWLAGHPDSSPVAEGIRIEKLKGDLDSALVAGDIDAVIMPDVLPSITAKDPRVRRLFRDYKTEEQKYFRETGIFPISHMVTLTLEFVEKHPNAPLALLKAFRAARDEAVNQIVGDNPQILMLSWASANLEEQRALMGEQYWPYNVENNRTVLESFTKFAHQQGVTSKQVSYESFFHPEAAAFPGS